MARHIKSGDTVQVIAGNDRGTQGKVLRVMPAEDKVVIEGVNVRYRHVRPNQRNQQGGRIQKEMPIHISNVQPVCPTTNKPTRVRFEHREDGSKVRVSARGGEVLSVLKKPKQ